MATPRFRNVLLFLIFVGVAAVFWGILALNEDSQYEYDVKIKLENVPDSVTFLSDPPTTARVSVRDKGTVLARLAFLNNPEIAIDFNRFANGSRMQVSQSSLNSYFRALFGKSAGINVLNLDSIAVPYTTAAPKEVPIVVDARITTELGKVVSGNPVPSVAKVKVYSYPSVLDTITSIHTETILLKGLSETRKVKVNLRQPANTRVEPSSVDVSINVVPLENRKAFVEITPINVPGNMSLVLFPAKVEVTYLTPMDNESIAEDMFSVVADYRNIDANNSDKVKIAIRNLPKQVVNASVGTDSVEYTIIRHD